MGLSPLTRGNLCRNRRNSSPSGPIPAHAGEPPFWDTHFAPNGWGCECRITSVTKRDGEASAEAGLGEPPEGWNDINPKTGEPVGIDKGFGYAPGANVKTPLQDDSAKS